MNNENNEISVNEYSKKVKWLQKSPPIMVLKR